MKNRTALATLASSTAAPQLSHSRGQKALLVQIMRPYLCPYSRPYFTTKFLDTSEPLGIDLLHSTRRMRAVLEVIMPQVHAGDHETTAAILHAGSHESLAVELVRLFIYLETNDMVR